MADDGEIDIEGDFELKLESDSSVSYDLNELPSKSANLLPEFTNPPWMLEQGWSLDACLDEKSKATIEKMLQEEQNYLNGRTVPKSPIKSDHRKGSTHKKPWTEEEKQYFIKGLEMYGRSWTKISELIPSRTSLQVKNYAQQHFKQQNKLAEAKARVNQDPPSQVSLPASLNTTLASVTTGQPTVQAGLASRMSRQRSAGSDVISSHDLSPLKLGLGSSLLQISSPSDSLGVLGGDLDGVLLVRDVPGDNLLSPGGSSVPDNSSSPGEDEDVDIDIENEDAEDNLILQSRSASPSSVYEALLKSANIRNRKHISTLVTAESSVENGRLASDGDSLSRGAASPESQEESRGQPETVSTIQDDSVVTNGLAEQRPEMSTTPVVSGGDLGQTYCNTIVTSNGDVIELDIPKKECVFERNKITDEEKRVHTEFFDGRPSKTPQRYLKIRNYILDSWSKCKPEYLNKTSVRPGLKNCGDVNCIGRIHSYLEQCGAINFGCEQACYNRPLKSGITKERSVEDKLSLSVEKMEAMRPRKRKIRDPFGFWVDEKDAEGKTIDHTALDQSTQSSSKSSRLDRYDPFKLIPCCNFDDKEPPFAVEMHSTALAIVDIHAHVSKTEVIGLLGGQYQEGRLEIVTAVPCVSVSTGMQCEMDPVSQTVAGEKIGSQGLNIVGWYHSHPTFAPNPSVRDLETQLKFQDWFAKGGSNFVGMIVNPYKRCGSAIQSEFRCLMVSDETSQNGHCNVPYQFDFKVAQHKFSADVVVSASEEVVCRHGDNPHRVDLLSMYRASDNLICLDKMLQSLQSYLPLETDGISSFLGCIRDMFGQRFTSDDIAIDIKDETDFDIVAEDTAVS
ncbi:histone H2A deubiquitinase MYSM1-like [Liolophura sinensis]|uniref:histone H2A deubiquitinase MYSM1-like n=1 Tax=Liolophura sinensis TaxID=3198878 RepID=UPI0031587823